ncbi:MAG: MogA/MoaB family molybdenum cofactor biosynthesis protein [Methanoregula sp.]|jgi:molybdenum cofactor biosynthesis protein B|uniref:MogA/MoaB family molybdenum cofactor biosynthesis protein n=1 Tax=Methanoregula sp. TaxID=2052170 RepID=UPI003D143248
MKQEHVQPILITGAVITVSTTRTKETDSSGKTIQAILTEAKIPVQHYAVVPDQIEAIRLELYQALKTCNCIIIDGGTGLTHDDCTIEAITPLLEKKIDGFGELFRMKSYGEIGTSTMLSRAVAGTIRGRVVFCIPGSTPAVTLATKTLIVPEIPHILSHANK